MPLILDITSGEVIPIPCMQEGLTAQVCADLYFREVFPLWGLPKKIRSDQDTRFKAEFWQNLHARLGTTLSMSTAYHPQSDGSMEREHREMNQIMCQLVTEEQDKWGDQIPYLRFCPSNSPRGSHGFSPFELTRTFTPRSLPGALEGASVAGQLAGQPARAYIDAAEVCLLKAHDAVIASRVLQTYYGNKHRRTDLEMPNITEDQRTVGEPWV